MGRHTKHSPKGLNKVVVVLLPVVFLKTQPLFFFFISVFFLSLEYGDNLSLENGNIKIALSCAFSSYPAVFEELINNSTIFVVVVVFLA